MQISSTTRRGWIWRPVSTARPKPSSVRPWPSHPTTCRWCKRISTSFLRTPPSTSCLMIPQLLAARANAPSLWWVYPYRAQATFRGKGERTEAAQELQNGLAATASLHNFAGTSQLMQTYASLLGVDAALKVAGEQAKQDPHWAFLAANLSLGKGDTDATINWLETARSHFDAFSSSEQDRILRMAAAEYLAKSPPDASKSARFIARFFSGPQTIHKRAKQSCLHPCGARSHPAVPVCVQPRRSPRLQRTGL